MTIPHQQQAYGSSTGTSPIPTYTFNPFDPTAQNTTPNFQLYSIWINTVTKAIWYLESFLSSQGVVTSQWRSVAPIIVKTVDPTTSDYQYPIGQTWVNSPGDNYFVLSSISGTTAHWIELSAGSASVDLFALQSGTTPIGPDINGIVTFSGAVVAAGTTPVQTSGTGPNTMTLQIQTSQASASSLSTKMGLSSFNSSEFTVDTNGFVSLVGTGASIESIQVDATGGTGVNPVVPNSSGTVQVTCAQVAPSSFTHALETITNAPNQYTITAQQANVSAGSNTAKNGIAHFDTNFFTTDGTGFISLKSSSAGVVNIQVFTSSGTYTPTTGMDYCIIEGVGGGGGGGGTSNCNGSQVSAGGGGGGGGYSRLVASAATIGVSQVVTIGAAGIAGTSGAGTGGTGGNSSVGSLLIAMGGPGGTGSTAATSVATQGANGGPSGTGTFSCVGSQGGDGIGSIAGGSGNFSCGGSGGNSFFGGETNANSTTSGQQVGLTGQQYGGGGSGGSTSPSGSGVAGGAGFAGLIVITEYI